MTRRVYTGFGEYIEVEKSGRIRNLKPNQEIRCFMEMDTAGRPYSSRKVFNAELQEWVPVDRPKIAHVRRWKPPKYDLAAPQTQ